MNFDVEMVKEAYREHMLTLDACHDPDVLERWENLNDALCMLDDIGETVEERYNGR